MRKFILLAFFTLLSVLSQAQQSDYVPINLSDQSPEIGIPVTFTFTLPDEYRAQSLKFSLGENPSTQMMLSEAPTSINNINWTGKLVFLTDALEDLKPFEVKAVLDNGDSVSLQTEPMPIVISKPSVEETTPFGYTLPDEPEVEWRRLIGAAIVGTLVFAAAVFALILLVRKYLKKNAEDNEARQNIQLTPLQYLQKESVGLSNKTVLNAMGLNAHYTHFSFILRKYLEDSTNIKALEMTDDELESALRQRKMLSSYSDLSIIFQHTSLAKFARSAFNDEIIDQDIDQLKDFIRSQEQLHSEESLSAEKSGGARK